MVWRIKNVYMFNICLKYISVIRFTHWSLQTVPQKGDEYAYDFLNSSVFGLGAFRFPFIAFLTAYGLVSEI